MQDLTHTQSLPVAARSSRPWEAIRLKSWAGSILAQRFPSPDQVRADVEHARPQAFCSEDLPIRDRELARPSSLHDQSGTLERHDLRSHTHTQTAQRTSLSPS